MNHLFDRSKAEDVKERIGRLAPESQRKWGTMSLPQTLAHCSAAMETTLGEMKPPRMTIGRILGPAIRHLALKDDAPMRRNSPTVPCMVVKDDRDLEVEKTRLIGLVDRFADGGAGCCTTHPHAFFGRLTPEQWAILTYKHVDHHLRQFGA